MYKEYLNKIDLDEKVQVIAYIYTWGLISKTLILCIYKHKILYYARIEIIALILVKVPIFWAFRCKSPLKTYWLFQ
jgi:hypothetical protein